METSGLEITSLSVQDWGLLEYDQALDRQEQLVQLRQQGEITDTLVLVEHPAVVTLGRRGSSADLRVPVADFDATGVALQSINRGGLATAHEPGQLVAYPILSLKRRDLRWFSNTFLGVVVDLLSEYGLVARLKPNEPGVWVNDGKICSFGIAVRKWISSHGVALNVNNELRTFEMIIPCGRPQERVTSVVQELGRPLEMERVKQKFIQLFCAAFAYRLNSDKILS